MIVFSCVALAFCANATASETYPIGYVTPSGYIFVGNGLWTRGDAFYTRCWIQPTYHQPGFYQYSYAPAPIVVQNPAAIGPPVQAPAPVAPPPLQGSVVNELGSVLLKLQALKKETADADALLRTTTGQQPQYQGGTGYAGPGGPASLQLSTAGVNANTVYGYSGQSFNSIASFYGDYNAMALFQMANRQQENAQKGADQAGKQFAELLAQEGGNRSRVAEIMAKAELLRAMFPPESRIETKSSSWKSEPPPMPTVDPPQAQIEPNALKQAWAGHAAKACGACHGGGKAEGGFALASFPTMDAAAKAEVLKRLDHKEAKRRMPKDAPPLSAADRKLWNF
jgi:mono/diheme cytochrome c family protein